MERDADRWPPVKSYATQLCSEWPAGKDVKIHDHALHHRSLSFFSTPFTAFFCVVTTGGGAGGESLPVCFCDSSELSVGVVLTLWPNRWVNLPCEGIPCIFNDE